MNLLLVPDTFITADDIVDDGFKSFDDYEKDIVIHKHAAYLRYVLNSFDYDQQDILEKLTDVKGLNFANMISAGAVFRDIDAEDDISPFYTMWTVETSGAADDDLTFMVKNDLDGLPIAIFPEVNEKISRIINNMARERFQRRYREEIALATNMVYDSDTEVIRKKLKEQHDAVARAMGYRDSGHTPLYSYSGKVPVGKTWGFTDINTHYSDHAVNQDQYQQAVDALKEYAGDKDLEHMWQIVRFDHFMTKWTEKVAIQCIFTEKHPWFLTPIFIEYANNIHDQWQEWDTSENFEYEEDYEEPEDIDEEDDDDDESSEDSESIEDLE